MLEMLCLDTVEEVPDWVWAERKLDVEIERQHAADNDPANIAAQAGWHQQQRDEAMMAASDAYYASVDARRCASVPVHKAGSRIRAHRTGSREHRARPSRRTRTASTSSSSASDGSDPPPPPRGGYAGRSAPTTRPVVAP